jgi:hypothetical protein
MQLIWLVFGIGLGMATICLTGYCVSTSILLPWITWVVICLWLVLAASSVAFILTSLWEGENQAAFRGGLVMVAASVITGALVIRFVL